jgi:hypothetical protein
MTGFLTTMKASFPDDMPFPEEFEKLFTWMEAHDFVQEFNGSLFAGLYPKEHKGTSHVEFRPVDRDNVKAWTQSDDPAVLNRVAPFVLTGNDGSEAALWRDDDGRLKFVHLGSGSGSVMLCVLTDNPVDFLRLLAIGYQEVCWPEHYDMTPEEVHEKGYDPYVPPLQFRAWVEETFGVEIPKTAAEIVTCDTPSMDDDNSDDPFWRWVRKLPSWDDMPFRDAAK